MAFDTLTYAKKLQEAGVPPQQAETHARALRETVEDILATKQDLQLVRQEVRELATRMDGRFKEADGRFTELETHMDGRFKELETRIDGRFRLLYWMVGFNLTLTLFTFSLTAGVLLKLLAG